MSTSTNSSTTLQASSRKTSGTTLIAWIACLIVIAAEIAYAVAVVGHGIHMAHKKPSGELSLAPLNALAQTDASIGVALAVASIVLIAALMALVKPLKVDRAPLTWALIFGALGAIQMGQSQALDEASRQEQPTNAQLITAFTECRYPAEAVIIAIIVFTVWYAITARAKGAKST